MRLRHLLTPLALLAGLVVPLTAATPAQAAARVSIANESGGAAIDDTHSTTLRVSGSGFQSVKNGHGGVYVFFGTVSGSWQPSRGGTSGSDYFYVPDSEAKNNQGFQKYVAFPGSDTASSANGGTMNGSGSWSTSVVVPGPVFEAYGRNNQTRTVDCRKETCGIITVGAHGVTSGPNETFTPVAVEDLYAAGPGDPAPTDSPKTTDTPVDTAPVPQTNTAATGASGAVRKNLRPALAVDRSSAVSGRVLSFNVSGLASGQQFSVIFDDGVAAAGPFQVGTAGQTTGVITLPGDLAAGTHELRVYGIANPPSVKFAVRGGEAAPVSTSTGTSDESSVVSDRWGIGFAALAGGVLLVALVRLVLTARGRRRAA